MHPFEDGLSAAEFHKNGGTPLRAIERYCLNCSGGCKKDRKNCQHVNCVLHPFRQGRNANRAATPEQREIKAARLKANVERGRRDRK
jgi:hypothetical protein